MNRLLLLILLIVPAASPAQGQEQEAPKKIPVRIVDAAGLEAVVEQQMRMIMRDDTDLEHEQRWTRRYRERVLEVKENRSVKVERAYQEHSRARLSGPRNNRFLHILHGNKVVLVRGEEGVTSPTKTLRKHSVPLKKDGTVAPNGSRELKPTDVQGEHVANPWRDALPKAEVAVGERWKIDAQVVRRVLGIASGDFKSAEGVGKLVEVLDYRGRRCAKIEFTLSGEVADPRHALKMSMKLSGHMYLDIERQQPLELSMQGRVASMNEEEIEHDGTLSYRETRRFDD